MDSVPAEIRRSRMYELIAEREFMRVADLSRIFGISEVTVRSDLVRNLGYFSTDSCGHFSEYVPYYRKRKDLLRRWCRPGYRGGTSFYADNWPGWRRATERLAALVPSECTLRLWDGLYHETHNEPEKQQVIEFALTWLDQVIGQPRPE